MKAFRILLVGTLITGVLHAQQNPRKENLFAFFGKGTISGGGTVGEILQTEFTFTNPGSRTAQILVRFFGKNGQELEIDLVRSNRALLPKPFELVGQSSLTVFTFFSFGTLAVGWVQIESSEPIAVLESINHLHVSDSPTAPRGPITSPLTSATLGPSLPVREFSLSVIEDEDVGSGISIAVPRSDEPAVDGELKLLNDAGNVIASKRISVGPREQFVQLGSELFPELVLARKGTMTAQFAREVIVASLRFGKKTFGDRRTLLLGPNLVSTKIME